MHVALDSITVTPGNIANLHHYLSQADPFTTDPLFAFPLICIGDLVFVEDATTNPTHWVKHTYKRGTRTAGGKDDPRVVGFDIKCPSNKARFGPEKSVNSSDNSCSSSATLKRIMACMPYVVRMDVNFRETFVM